MWNIDEGTETLEIAAEKRRWLLEQLDKRTYSLIEHVKEEAARGESINRLAKRAGVSRVTIYSWLSRDSL